MTRRRRQQEAFIHQHQVDDQGTSQSYLQAYGAAIAQWVVSSPKKIWPYASCLALTWPDGLQPEREQRDHVLLLL